MTGARHVRYVASRGERRAEVIVEEVDPGAGLYRVTIDGRTRLVEWAPAASRNEGSLRIDDRFQHEFALIHEGPERRHVELSHGRISVECVEALVAEARESSPGAGASLGEELLAPIPGRVVKVLVEPGQAITSGQAIVILEAMKMQNELRASGDGVVEKIVCREGEAVDGGTLLVVIAPPPKG